MLHIDKRVRKYSWKLTIIKQQNKEFNQWLKVKMEDITEKVEQKTRVKIYKKNGKKKKKSL